jgi:hypothetical protein
MRPALAAAVGCGVLGGSLVGLGALGFDKVEVAAAPCVKDAPASTPASTPAPDPGNPATGEDLVTGQPVSTGPMTTTASMNSANEAALAETPVDTPVRAKAVESGPHGEDTTIAPEIGPLKPVDGVPCEPDPVVIPLPGPAPDPTGPSDVPDDEDTGGEQPVTDDPDPVEDPATPTPTPVVTPPPTPTPVVDPPVISPNPALPAPSTTTRGTSRTSRPTTPTPRRTGTITRAEVIARAVSWVSQAVPYSQSRWWTDLNGTFRQDCSGYVSMAWRTDQRINYWTGNLGTVSDRIASASMQPGDILLLPGKHTTIFAGWANTSKTKFHLFEEYRTGYPARFVRNASLSYYLDRGYGSYRYDGIRDAVMASIPLPVATPVPTPVPVPEDDPAPMTTQSKRERQDTVALLSAQSGGTTTAPTQQTWTIEQTIAGLPATDWTPGTAEDYTPEAEAVVTSDSPADADELALASAPVEQLVSAQQQVDEAEEQRLAAMAQAALPSTENRTSGAGVILAAGLGLLFIAIPLGAASRRSWAANSAAVPPVPPERGHL